MTGVMTYDSYAWDTVTTCCKMEQITRARREAKGEMGC